MLVVVGNMYGEDGGNIREWGGTSDELNRALARGEVTLFDAKRCPAPVVCECGKEFITRKALVSHQTERRPGRLCPAGLTV